MSFRDPRVLAWEARLKQVFDVIDHELEDAHGDRYPLHPVRAARGETENPASDGLFEIGAAFTTGYGSEKGRGYVVSARISTLSRIPSDIQEKLNAYVAERLSTLLPEYFPGQELRVERDGPVFKIVGDLAL